VGADAGLPDSAGADALPAVTLDTLCNVDDGGMLEYFERLFECYPELAFLLERDPTRAEMSAACYGAYDGYFDDGTIAMGTWDDYQECLAYIGATTCDELSSENPVQCRNVFMGTVDNGDACEVDEQCAKRNAYCDVEVEGTCGTCRDGLPNGRACSDSSECASGNCVGPALSDGTCQYFGVVGDTCYEDFDCLGRLMCDTALDECIDEPSWGVGSPCDDFGADCGFPVSDLYCDTGAGACVKWGTLGGSCGLGQPLCNVLRYESCGAATCNAPTIVGEGAACSMFGGAKCGAGLVCSNPFEGGACVAPGRDGDACGDAAPCDVFLECAGGRCGYGAYTGECPAT
jgi:hypothetical protein